MRFIKLLFILFLTSTMGIRVMAESSVETKLQNASSAYSSGKYAESAELIEQALEEVKVKAPLTVKNFYPVRRKADYFGAFEPRESNVYESAEALYFYLEPKNVVFVKKGEAYTGGFFIDIAIKDDKGDVVFEQKKFLDAQFNSREPIHDLFTNVTLTMTGAPVGTYNVAFTVRDQNSDKSATVEKEVKIK
jgi:hypothetical protein